MRLGPPGVGAPLARALAGRFALVPWVTMLGALASGCSTSTPPDPPPERGEAAGPVDANDLHGAVRYLVEVLDAPHHLLRVSVEAALEPRQSAPDARLPVWTPGSYLVREHARHVERFEAFAANGEPLAVRKVGKSRWRAEGAPGGAIRYRYTLYAHELSVRTAFVADDYGVLDPAAVFVALEGRDAGPLEVRFEIPEGWRIETLLPRHPSARPGEARFVAHNYEQLIDAPALLGPVEVDRFEVAGVPHRIAYVGRIDRWDRDRARRDVQRIVEAARTLWGGLPYRRYGFLQVLEGERGSGLEHAEGALLLASPLAMRREDDYRDWLGLVAHELFHAWNVERLRPVELRHYDLEREQLTPSLWVAEGLTSYFDDLLLARAGLLDESRYLERLSEQVRAVQRTPGRRWQPLTEASRDAWIKFYRPDEQSPNATISYYRKGAVVGWLLDALIREATGGRRALEDAMRLAYARFAGSGYTHEGFREVLEEVAGRSLQGFYARYVEGTEELDYTPALRWFGLRFAGEGDGEREEPAGGLGVRVERREGRLFVAHVLRGGPGWRAGVSAGDELLAIDGYRVASRRGLEALQERLRPGEDVTVLLVRRSRVRSLRLTVGMREPVERWRLEADPAASGVQRARRRSWLSGSREAFPLSGLLQSRSP